MKTPKEILEELKKIRYPGLSRDIVSFGMVRNVEVGSEAVTVTLAPTTAKPEVVQELTEAVRRHLQAAAGVETVDVQVVEAPAGQKRSESGRTDVPGIQHIVAVASGKGGVGKSTVAANLACALGQLGHRVGLLDADVYGPSLPLMFGLDERPQTKEEKRIVPLERYGLKIISLGSFIERRTPVIWRGPMINKLLVQFFREVEWGDLDFLILDLPPGTGDAQLTITQQVPLAGGVIVTTPQDVALADVRRGIKMFGQVNAPVLGVIENMSGYECSGCGEHYDLFGRGGGRHVAEQYGLPLLGTLPLLPDLRQAADDGTPLVVAEPEHAQSRAFREIAGQIASEIERRAAEALPTIH